MKTISLEILPGDKVDYIEGFSNYRGAKLDHIQIHKFGLYAVITLDGESYTVPYKKLQRCAS